MKIHQIHDWEMTPKEAVALQRELAERVEISGGPSKPTLIAGADMAIDKANNRAFGAVVVLRFRDLEVVEKVTVEAPLPFPYVPGLLSFRELPVLIEAFRQVQSEPDIVFLDGQGRIHPRRLGLACHLGLFLDVPTIGCAKSPLCDDFAMPDTERGSSAPVIDKGEQLGVVLRTRTNVKPMYISPGHKIGLSLATRHVLAVSPKYRIPIPTKEADFLAGVAKREALAAEE